jgi:hypothetical protein
MDEPTGEAITFYIAREHNGRYGFTASIADDILHNRFGPAILEQFASMVLKEAVRVYMETHGAALLESLAPGVVADEIKKALAAKVLDILKSDRDTTRSRTV